MKTNLILFRLAVFALILISLSTLYWVHITTSAQIESFRAFLQARRDPAPVDDFDENGELMSVLLRDLPAAKPVSPLGLATLTALETPIDFPFAIETPLQDFLAYFKQEVRDRSRMTGPLNVYLDPTALAQVNATEESTVTINLKAIAASRGLELALRQLSLTHYIDEAGIVVIKARGDDEIPKDRFELILRCFDNLSRDVRRLKASSSPARAGGGPAPASQSQRVSGPGGVFAGIM